MPAKAKQMLMFFRGRRGIVLLVAVGVALFFVLGGYRTVSNLALNKMAGFLIGTSDIEYQATADSPVAVCGEETQVGAPESGPPQTALLSANTFLSAVQATPAEASPTEETETALAQAKSDSSGMEMPGGEAGLPSRQTVPTYTASFLRDPFASLIGRDEKSASKLLDVSNAKMVGSVWGESGIIALLEDDAGRSYALKVGDKVVNGSVVSVTPASVTFSITVFGLTRSVTLELAEEGEW
jgi:hypothetical protein